MVGKAKTQGWNPEGVGPRRVEAPKGGEANISRFFSLSRHIFWCLKHQFAGCRVPGGPKARGCSCHGPTRDVLFSGDKKIVIDIFGGSKRHGWGSTVGDPKKQHKQQQKQHKTELKKKQQHKQNKQQEQQKAQTTSRTSRSKFHKQQHKEHQNSSKNSKRSSESSNGSSTNRIKMQHKKKIFGHRGFTWQPENCQTRTIKRPDTSNTTKIPRERPPEREDEFCGGRGKKRAKFWASHPSDPHPSNSRFLGPWGPHPSPPTHDNKTQKNLNN